MGPLGNFSKICGGPLHVRLVPTHGESLIRLCCWPQFAQTVSFIFNIMNRVNPNKKLRIMFTISSCVVNNFFKSQQITRIYSFFRYIFTGRNEVVAKVMFLHVCVILFTPGRVSGQGEPPPQAGRPPESRPPPPEQPPPPLPPRDQTPPVNRITAYGQ